MSKAQIGHPGAKVDLLCLSNVVLLSLTAGLCGVGKTGLIQFDTGLWQPAPAQAILLVDT